MKDGIRITVIATGFDAVKEQQVPAAEETARPLEFPKRTYDRDDLDIPAFLRRSRQSSRRRIGRVHALDTLGSACAGC